MAGSASCGSVRRIAPWLLLVVALGVSGAYLASPSHADDPAQKKAAPAVTAQKSPLSQFMQVKLGFAQSFLDGLVTEDFDKITASAESLSELSQSERWRVSNDAMYRQYSNEYERTVKQALKSAKARNLDGAALAYVQLTMSCVECHKFVRNELVMQK